MDSHGEYNTGCSITQGVPEQGLRVPPGLHNANLSTDLPGDVLSLVGVHAKVRRDGYRK